MDVGLGFRGGGSLVPDVPAGAQHRCGTSRERGPLDLAPLGTGWQVAPGWGGGAPSAQQTLTAGMWVSV